MFIDAFFNFYFKLLMCLQREKEKKTESKYYKNFSKKTFNLEKK
jgi:hypothetical protein